MHTKGIRIISQGDNSVGILSAEYNMPGPFTFENENDFLLFKENVLKAFSILFDDCYINTFEEIDDELKRDVNIIINKTYLEALKNIVATPGEPVRNLYVVNSSDFSDVICKLLAGPNAKTELEKQNVIQLYAQRVKVGSGKVIKGECGEVWQLFTTDTDNCIVVFAPIGEDIYFMRP